MKVGLLVSIANARRSNSVRSYHSIRTVALEAEAAGFDSIWMVDHLFYRRSGEPAQGIWESWTLLAALAEATRRVEIGPLVACNSFRNPAILAKMAVTADEVSGGRIILGVGAGWNEPEYRAFGLPFDHRVSRFEEALHILRPLLRAGHVDFTGQYYRAPECEIAPRGPRPEGPPLMIGGEGPRMLRLAAQHGDLWNTGYMGQPETMAEPLRKIQAACRQVGRDPATLGVTALIGLWFPDLLASDPNFEDHTLTGTVQEIAAAMHGYEQRGVQHIIFQVVPYTEESRERLIQALQLYRGQTANQ